MTQRIEIMADYREKPSGIPEFLEDRGVEIELKELKTGDYLINSQIIVERKTKEDFVQTLVSNRLFSQCQRMKRSNKYQLLIIEGNPYKTRHDINSRAIKGAILSISIAWQIPVFLTKNREETADILVMAGKQLEKESMPLFRPGYKPKKPERKKLFFLQGLPEVGPVIALRLVERFESVGRIINASETELLEIEGIGTEKAKQIVDFIKY